MLTVRTSIDSDAAFLIEMLAVAADWRPGTRPRTSIEVMAEPKLAHYVLGWRREGDFGVIAEEQRCLGAAWWRFFPADDPGYGYVDANVPELSIGVVNDARGRSTGRQLLTALMGEARHRELPALSLSVEQDNPAIGLYEHLGFRPVGAGGGAVTMLCATADRRWPDGE